MFLCEKFLFENLEFLSQNDEHSVTLYLWRATRTEGCHCPTKLLSIRLNLISRLRLLKSSTFFAWLQ
jgi:hypothetical protein